MLKRKDIWDEIQMSQATRKARDLLRADTVKTKPGAGMAPRQKSTRINTGLALFPMVMMLIMLSTCNLEVSTMCATCAPSMPALIGAWEPRYTI